MKQISIVKEHTHVTHTNLLAVFSPDRLNKKTALKCLLLGELNINSVLLLQQNYPALCGSSNFLMFLLHGSYLERSQMTSYFHIGSWWNDHIFTALLLE